MILTELFFIIGYFLVYGSYINFHVDFFLHHCRKIGIADQLNYHFGYGIIQKLFPYLLFVITLMPSLHTSVFTAIIEEILIFRAVLFVFNALIPIHLCTAYRTLHNSRKQVRPFIFSFINVFIFFYVPKRNLPHKAVSAVLFNTERFLAEADNLRCRAYGHVCRFFLVALIVSLSLSVTCVFLI